MSTFFNFHISIARCQINAISSLYNKTHQTWWLYQLIHLQEIILKESNPFQNGRGLISNHIFLQSNCKTNQGKTFHVFQEDQERQTVIKCDCTPVAKMGMLSGRLRSYDFTWWKKKICKSISIQKSPTTKVLDQIQQKKQSRWSYWELGVILLSVYHIMAVI